MDHVTYVHKAFTNHLSDAATYQSLPPYEAHATISTLTGKIVKLIVDHHDKLTPNHRKKFLLNSMMEVKDPFPPFYLTFKIHKQPLKTRPVVPVSGSLLHLLGQWLDIQLQPLVRKLPSFIASSF